MTQCFSVSAVSQPTPKGPGLWGYKGQNQWERWKNWWKTTSRSPRGTRERRAWADGGAADHQHLTQQQPLPPPRSAPVPLSLSDGHESLRSCRVDIALTSLKPLPDPRDRAKIDSGTDQNNHTRAHTYRHECRHTHTKKRNSSFSAHWLQLSGLTAFHCVKTKQKFCFSWTVNMVKSFQKKVFK